jgi:fused signal recognition particle receptor
MSFFKKLKDRMFKSSSKIEEGLDAIIEDGGIEEVAIEDASVVQEAERVEAERAETERAETERVEAAREVERVEVARREAERHEAQLAVIARKEAEDVRLALEEKRRADESAAEIETWRQAECEAAETVAQDATDREIASAKEQAKQAEADLLKQRAQDAADATAERARQQLQAAKLEAATARVASEDVEQTEEPVENTEVSHSVPLSERAPIAAALNQDTAAEDTKKPGFLGRILGRSETKTVVRRVLDDDMLESLEELLITADMGVDTALRVTANMAEGRFGKKLSVDEIKGLLADEVTRIMEPVASPMPIYAKKPQVVLVVGVNGSGKTTTIGKLASQFRAAGKSVVIAAGDTFRAAAVEQLQVWGERAGVPVLTAPEGSDPASLAYDAMTQAESDGVDLLLIDTAGRLQNRQDLMEELQKIVRVIRKKDPEAPHNTLLVLDATTGQNAVSQVKTFQELADVSGLVMTKLDGTAKGGVLVALADKFGLPIHAIGVGEQIDDLAPFDPEEFADALTGRAR